MSRGAALSVVGAFVVFVLFWQGVVIVSGFPPFILPGPGAVAARLVTAWTDGTIQPHLATTLVEVGLGFAVGAGLALVSGARARIGVACAATRYGESRRSTTALRASA